MGEEQEGGGEREEKAGKGLRGRRKSMGENSEQRRGLENRRGEVCMRGFGGGQFKQEGRAQKR